MKQNENDKNHKKESTPFVDNKPNGKSQLNGTDPNKITFAISLTNQYVSTNWITAGLNVQAGYPASYSVLIDSTNFSGATWSPYTSSNILVYLGSTDGPHDLWVGLRGLPSYAQQTWDNTTVVLDSTTPSITITNPSSGASFNASRVNVAGNFSSEAIHQVTVNDTVAFINGTNFEAVNVLLSPSVNTITAIVEDLNGDTNSASITITALTNSDGTLNDPVQLSATPVAGLSPLPVAFQAYSSAPGTLQHVYYDFNGDGIADLTTNNLTSLTYTYPSNGQFFPDVTVQTTTGRFSNAGGTNGLFSTADNLLLRINVVTPPVQVSSISVTDPVDLKWTATSNLYVLSGSTSTITEYDTNGSVVRSLSSIGLNPTGLDVDAIGNVYVAIAGSNQVCRFKPTTSSFQVDTTFGTNGYIGITNGISGTNPGQFNAPYDVALSPDGGTVSVSDSGNDRIQQFDTNGAYVVSFGTSGGDVGQFDSPAGLTYDAGGTLNNMVNTIFNYFTAHSDWFVPFLLVAVYLAIESRWEAYSRRRNYEELRILNELREKSIITQSEFDEKKEELLST